MYIEGNSDKNHKNNNILLGWAKNVLSVWFISTPRGSHRCYQLVHLVGTGGSGFSQDAHHLWKCTGI